MRATEALELIVDMIERSGTQYGGDFESLSSLIAEIETMAISYGEMDYLSRRDMVEEK